MAVFGIANSIFSQLSSFAPHGKSQQIQQGFQLLGQDLQSGNLSQAQSDFSSLQQLIPSAPQNFAASSTPAAQSNNPLATAVSQLAKDLQSGNLSAAQSDLSTVQHDVQQIGQQQGTAHAHHHHHHGVDKNQSSANANDVSTLFGQLGQSLQAGNLSAAQQAYSSLQQDFQLFSQNNSSNISGNSVSLSA